MTSNIVFVDYENVQIPSLALLKPEHFRVLMFLGANNVKLPVPLFVSMQNLGQRVELVVLEASGKNALDFHIAYYLGVMAQKEPAAFFHVISKDSGFDPLFQHLKAKKISCVRSASIEEMPCFQAPAPIEVVVPVEPEPTSSPTVQLSHTGLVAKAVTLVIHGKASRPTTRKTLVSTLHAKLGKELPIASIEKVVSSLSSQGHIKINGTKISYVAPAAKP